MKENNYPDIRFSAQRALWGNVPCSLRAFSAQIGRDVVRCRSIFDETASNFEKDLLSVAGSEIIADFPEPFKIEKEFLVVPEGNEMQHLSTLIFLRYEP